MKFVSSLKANPTRSLATEGYWRDLGADDFAGQTLANCVEAIHGNIVDVWNFPDKDKVRLLFPSRLSFVLKDTSVLVKQSI